MTQRQVLPSRRPDQATRGRKASSTSMDVISTRPGAEFKYVFVNYDLVKLNFQWWTLHLSRVKLWKEDEECEWSETPHVFPSCGIQNSWSAKGGGNQERKGKGKSSDL